MGHYKRVGSQIIMGEFQILVKKEENMSHVVTTQPQSNEWTTGLLGCTEDVGNCLFTAVCPFCSMCVLRRRLGVTCCHACFPFCWTCVRGDYRDKQGHGQQGTLNSLHAQTISSSVCSYEDFQTKKNIFIFLFCMDILD